MDKYRWTWISQIKPGDTALMYGCDVPILAVEERHEEYRLTVQKPRGKGLHNSMAFGHDTMLYIKAREEIAV